MNTYYEVMRHRSHAEPAIVKEEISSNHGPATHSYRTGETAGWHCSASFLYEHDAVKHANQLATKGIQCRVERVGEES